VAQVRTKTTTPAPDVSQQIEPHLDKLDQYTNDQLNEIVHVFIYRRPTNMVLVEYVDVTPNYSEKYITRDSLNAVMFWQGHQTLHMRKLNVRIHDSTLFHHRFSGRRRAPKLDSYCVVMSIVKCSCMMSL